jgi:hypothetical protein
MKNSTIVKVVFVAAIIMVGMQVNAQVAINTDGSAPDGSAMLDITSTSKGLLIPRMTISQRNSIPSPTNGLVIFQTDEPKGIYFYDGSVGSWILQGASSTSWDVDTYGLNTQSGNVGIGVESDPSTAFYVQSTPLINTYVSIFENGRNHISAYGIKIKAGSSTTFSDVTRFIGFFSDASTIKGAITYSGGVIALANLSDKNLKTNIHETRYSLNDLMKVNVRDFNWKESNQASTGFVAQELFEVFPEAVIVPNDKNEPWMVSPTTLIPIMVKSIQDQQMIIKSQEEKIKSLEDRLSAVEKLLAK